MKANAVARWPVLVWNCFERMLAVPCWRSRFHMGTLASMELKSAVLRVLYQRRPWAYVRVPSSAAFALNFAKKTPTSTHEGHAYKIKRRKTDALGREARLVAKNGNRGIFSSPALRPVSPENHTVCADEMPRKAEVTPSHVTINSATTPEDYPSPKVTTVRGSCPA